jgi:hypothetical protein
VFGKKSINEESNDLKPNRRKFGEEERLIESRFEVEVLVEVNGVFAQ